MIIKSTKEIFEAQIKDGYFRRMDIVVHYLAIENYYGKNDFGLELCLNVHKKRTRCSHERSERRVCGFKKLISNMTKENFNTRRYPLQINLRSMDIVQGSHRMAIALYLGIDNVYVVGVHRRKREFNFGTRWFEKVGFDNDTLIMLENKKELILKGLLK